MTTIERIVRGLCVVGFAAAALPLSAAQGPPPAQAAPVSAWIRYAGDDKDIRMRSARAEVVIDTTARRLVVRHDKRPLNIPFDRIRAITFEKTTHMRGGRGGGLGAFGLAGVIASAAIKSGTINDHWSLIEYEDDDRTARTYLLEFGEKEAPDVLRDLQTLFGERATVANFGAQERLVPKKDIPKPPKVTVTVHKERGAVPEARPDKALLVVVCPAIDVRNAGKGNTHLLFADGTLVGANKMGTFNAIFLDPGPHTFLSVTSNGSELTMTLDAGQQYFFYQDTLSGRSVLSRHTRVLVLNELAGSYRAEWAIKK